ncbi:GIY-YIG nuclease family protein [Candidatus Roizmanbacteria bacterium]|nr:GIY-YIG nuclease family protein [Candidatus Roizmanbacteria bacterium]
MDPAAPLAFVDVETTGLSPVYDRIIEIGIVRVEDNKVVATCNQLINPDRHVPSEIFSLTGIRREELVNAPLFVELEKHIQELLDGAVFVAHNVRFDYSFVKHEFERLERPFKAPLLCTARLSRALFPQFLHHDLSTIIERLGLQITNRHRAFDDAHVLWQFYQHIKQRVTENDIVAAIARIQKKPTLPPLLDPETIEKLPETAGVYFFHDKGRNLLYIGKAINIRARVLSHFSADASSQKQLAMCRQIADITWIETAGELGALLRESELIKTMQPIYNRQLRNHRGLVIARQHVTKEGYQSVVLDDTAAIDVNDIDSVLGVYRSKRKALDFMSFLAEKYHLCKKILGIDHSSRTCFDYHLGICRGACCGEEPAKRYNLRALLAFAENKIKPWYFDRPVEIIEKQKETGKWERFILHKWCLIQHTTSSDDILPTGTLFDIDRYKILSSYLSSYYFRRGSGSFRPYSIKPLSHAV